MAHVITQRGAVSSGAHSSLTGDGGQGAITNNSRSFSSRLVVGGAGIRLASCSTCRPQTAYNAEVGRSRSFAFVEARGRRSGLHGHGWPVDSEGQQLSSEGCASCRRRTREATHKSRPPLQSVSSSWKSGWAKFGPRMVVTTAGTGGVRGRADAAEICSHAVDRWLEHKTTRRCSALRSAANQMHVGARLRSRRMMAIGEAMTAGGEQLSTGSKDGAAEKNVTEVEEKDEEDEEVNEDDEADQAAVSPLARGGRARRLQVDDSATSIAGQVGQSGSPVTIAESAGSTSRSGRGTSAVEYLTRVKELLRPDGGPPRWFCPIDARPPTADLPLMLFLPGGDGTGLSLSKQYESMSRFFELWCLCSPAGDRTPFVGLPVAKQLLCSGVQA
ncbi:hypothetical protein CBR_g23993 [Chara braunii]|uniref:Uncharacterized protein n=1 Tax=Chara braunii TaxID=69332 RepID=A0A388L5L3_CHABU|nr:hypothetical protein CBR_g23993 [Chara braunii]|eukprot:GBG77548.1 hypothetical protein CBR_g23993 [Chara braunii]